MIDYRARLQDLYDVLARYYHVTDTQAVDILLAARLESAKLPYPWLLIETAYFSRDVDPTHLGAPWFYFGLPAIGRSFAELRLQRASKLYRDGGEIAQELTGAGPRLWVEPDWDNHTRHRYRSMQHMEAWQMLYQKLLTVRTEHPKHVPGPEARFELARAAEAVLDVRWRQTQPSIASSLAIPYWLEVLQLLSPRLRSWEELCLAVNSLARRLCWLRDLREPDKQVNAAIARVVADSVPSPVAKILCNLGDVRGRTMADLTRAGLCEGEVRRLRKAGVVRCTRAAWRLDMPDALRLVRGEIGL